jgi:Flp pilus assembly CpaE family ATPase
MCTNIDELPDYFLDRVFETHPTGLTVKEAFEEMSRREELSAKSFAEMIQRINDEAAHVG